MIHSFSRATFACLLAVIMFTSFKKNNPVGHVIKKDISILSPNFVTGNIYDARGNKFNIPGATVIVNIVGTGNIGNEDPFYNIPMDANGHYEMKVSNNLSYPRDRKPFGLC